MALITEVKSKRQMQEFVTASQVTNYLSSTYPNFRWMSAVDSTNGIIKILEQNLMDATVPYVIRIAEVNTHKKLQKMLKKAGGEILERFYINRERMSANKVHDTVQGLAKNFQGKVLFDHRGAPNWLGQKSGGGNESSSTHRG